jgi:uncharacterized protein Veg
LGIVSHATTATPLTDNALIIPPHLGKHLTLPSVTKRKEVKKLTKGKARLRSLALTAQIKMKLKAKVANLYLEATKESLQNHLGECLLEYMNEGLKKHDPQSSY